MPDALSALRSSADRLTGLVSPLGDDAVASRAHPTEWTIADVVSHLGSGAVIGQRRLEDALAGAETPDDFNQAVWDEWNAKSPRAKASDGLAAINAYVSRLESVTPADRARFKSRMGPFELDWDALLGLRLNEQLLHEWDVAVALDPAATLAADGTELVIDNLDLITRFTARPHGEPRTITIATTAPERSFAVNVEPAGVGFAAAEPAARPDLSMPAEAFIRLAYGRLDPGHTPDAVTGDPAVLDQLRAVFPGP